MFHGDEGKWSLGEADYSDSLLSGEEGDIDLLHYVDFSVDKEFNMCSNVYSNYYYCFYIPNGGGVHYHAYYNENDGYSYPRMVAPDVFQKNIYIYRIYCYDKKFYVRNEDETTDSNTSIGYFGEEFKSGQVILDTWQSWDKSAIVIPHKPGYEYSVENTDYSYTIKYYDPTTIK